MGILKTLFRNKGNGKKALPEMGQSQRQEIILVAIYLLSQISQKGKEKELSRSELVNCLKKVGKASFLGYGFPEKPPYISYEFDSDLIQLVFNGFIKNRKYGRCDDYLFPVNFMTLESRGKEWGEKIITTLDPEMIEALNKAVRTMGVQNQISYGYRENPK